MSGQNNSQGGNIWISIVTALASGVIFKTGEEVTRAGVQSYRNRVVYPDGFRQWSRNEQFGWLIRLENEDELWKHAKSKFKFTPENMSCVVCIVLLAWWNVVCDDQESKENIAAFSGMESLLTFGYLREMADKEKGSYLSLKRLVGAMLYRHDEYFKLLKPWRKKIEARCTDWETDRYEALIACSDVDFWSRGLQPTKK